MEDQMKFPTNQVFAHSPYADFADTQSWFRSVFKTETSCSPRIHLFYCRCGLRNQRLMRIRRPRWMRVIAFFRLYVCTRCRSRVFRWRTRQRPFYGVSVSMPPPGRRLRYEEWDA